MIGVRFDILLTRPLRDATRGLARARGYAAVSVLSVAGAIGLVCSAYSVIAATFWAELPLQDPGSLVEFWQTSSPESTQPQDYVAPLRMEEWVSHQQFRTLQKVAATGMGPSLVLRQSEGAAKVSSAPVVGDWFGTIGATAEIGRVLTSEDLRPGAPPAAVVSDAFWRDQMGAGPLGDIVLSGVKYVVVGVMPASLHGTSLVWIPAATLPEGIRPAAYAGVGRLRPGTSIAQAASEVEHLAAAQVREDSARYAGLGATVRSFGGRSRAADRSALWILLGVVFAVLLVALNNLTVLSLVRAQARSASLAVRASLGAGRWELSRGLAAEGATIGLAGAGLGLALAFWGKNIASGYVAPGLGRPVLGPGTVAVALVLGIATAMVIGLAPVRRVSSMNLQQLLQRRSGGADSTPGERRMRQVLVGAQVGICVVLIAVALVLTSAYSRYAGLDVGVDARRVVEIHPDWELDGAGAEEQWRTSLRVADRLKGAAGVSGATAWRMLGEDVPPRPEFDATTDGPGLELSDRDKLFRYYEVRPGFFEVLGLELVAGRPFGPGDGSGTAPVVIVTERAARVWWPGSSPLGRQLKLGSAGTWMTVVGVARDLQQLDELGRTVATRPTPPMPLAFVPQGQFESVPTGWRPFDCCAGVRIGVRGSGHLRAATQAVRQVLAEEVPDLPLVSVKSLYDVQMQGYVGQSIVTARRLMALGLAIALALALVGIVGVVGEALARRNREIGLRIALGARALQVSWAVARESALTATVGVVSGLLAVALLHTWLSKAVFDFYVQRLAPGVLSIQILGPAAAAVLIATLVAVGVTARRTQRVDPIEALRAE